MNEDIVIPIAGMISTFVLFPLSIAFVRYIWKRTSAPPPLSSAETDMLAQRMADLQHSMDSMAVEIERIAESQRFVTKLMSERPVAELAAQSKTSSRKSS